MDMKSAGHIIKIAFMICLVLSISSCNDLVENSNSSDALKYSYANLAGGTYFKMAVPTIIAKCANCHTHAAWYSYSETDYFNEGLIVPSDIPNSMLYYRLSNATEGPGPKNMPQGGNAAFTDAETELLTNWINNFGI